MPFGTGISSAVQINVLLPIFYYSAKVAFLSYCDFFFFFLLGNQLEFRSREHLHYRESFIFASLS